MDWQSLARAALAPWTAGATPYQSALLQPPASEAERKLYYLGGYEAALLQPYGGMLVHGPGATQLLNAPRDGDGNSAVFACLAALAAAYIEAPLRVYRRTGPGKQQELPDHPLQALLTVPNPVMSPLEVWAWVQWAKHLDGNAYLRKMRSGHRTRGNVIELWPISPCRIELRSEGGRYISAYRYHYAPGEYEDIPPENMIHLRYGLDDRDHRKGLSPMRRLLRAVTTDERAQQWTDSLLANYAIPGLLVTTKARLRQEEADALKAKVRSLYGNDRRGDVGVLDSEADMKQFGFSPEQMELGELHDIPETRIAAVFRVPPIVAGLRAGLQRATYSNFREAREAFTESTLMPLWAMDAAVMQARLVPDFAASDRRIVVAHDLTDVRALQEDEDAKYTRLQRAVGGPWVTVNEARADTGLPPLPDGDVLLVPINVTPTAPDALLPEPEPAAEVVPEGAPVDDEIPAPFRNMGGPRAERKQDDRPDPAVITDADLEAFRERGRALGLRDFVEATVNGNGSNGHGG